MKIRLERGDTAFEAERDPMPPERFRAVCVVLLAILYAVVVIVTIALSGIECAFILIPVTLAFAGAVYWVSGDT
nr:hypothetical protein [uncultured Oscillibacter sp.]